MGRPKQPPTLKLHKATGQGYVLLDGRRHYLGRYDDPATRQRADRLVAEWLSNGRALPAGADDLRVVELVAAFLRHAREYYVAADGTPTSSQATFSRAVEPLNRLYGRTPVSEFGPIGLRAVRGEIVAGGVSRSTANKYVGHIRHIFRWGVSHGMVPVDVHTALTTLEPLRRGRSAARETGPVRPVDDGVIEATVRHLPPVVADMVRVQRRTGMRPGELCTMRWAEIDTEGDVWIYRPAWHKTAYREGDRVVCIGPAAQAVLMRYRNRPADACVFSVRESERQRAAAKAAARKSKPTPKQLEARRRAEAKRERMADFYTRPAYTRAVRRACEAAGLEPHWTPNQLRHARATEVRKAMGLEAAQVVLGHTRADTTQIYAERDAAKAREVALATG